MQRIKIRAVYEYLQNITDKSTDNDLVFMIDALDTWLQLSPTILIERFEELGTSGVVVGADKWCFPNSWESIACTGAPRSTLPKGVYRENEEPRWANSGTVLGSVIAMRTLYYDMFDVFQEPEHVNETDQSFFNEFLTAGRGGLSVDYHSRLFWTTFANPPEVAHFINTPHFIDSVIPHELFPPLLYQGLTGEIPLVIHFNGQKGPRDAWWGKLWWNKLQDGDEKFKKVVAKRVEGAVVRFAGGGWKEWRDLCPNNVLGV